MTIKYTDKEVELHYSLRMFIIYENIMGKSLNYQDLASYTELITLFYSAIMSSFKYHKIEGNFNWDEFIEWVDENGGDSLMQEFVEWLVEKTHGADELIKEVAENNTTNKASKNY